MSSRIQILAYGGMGDTVGGGKATAAFTLHRASHVLVSSCSDTPCRAPAPLDTATGIRRPLGVHLGMSFGQQTLAPRALCLPTDLPILRKVCSGTCDFPCHPPIFRPAVYQHLMFVVGGVIFRDLLCDMAGANMAPQTYYSSKRH